MSMVYINVVDAPPWDTLKPMQRGPKLQGMARWVTNAYDEYGTCIFNAIWDYQPSRNDVLDLMRLDDVREDEIVTWDTFIAYLAPSRADRGTGHE